MGFLNEDENKKQAVQVIEKRYQYRVIQYNHKRINAEEYIRV